MSILHFPRPVLSRAAFIVLLEKSADGPSTSPLVDGNADGARMQTAEVYFGLDPHLHMCVKCGAEVK